MIREYCAKQTLVAKIPQIAEGSKDDRSWEDEAVSLSAFRFLFSELVQYNQTQIDNIAELERRLEDARYAVGHGFWNFFATEKRETEERHNFWVFCLLYTVLDGKCYLER